MKCSFVFNYFYFLSLQIPSQNRKLFWMVQALVRSRQRETCVHLLHGQRGEKSQGRGLFFGEFYLSFQSFSTSFQFKSFFKAIDEVYLDHLNVTKSNRPHSTFIVKTKKRLYHLQAPSDQAARIWIDAIITGAQGNLSEFYE